MGDKEREIISAFDLFSFFHIKKKISQAPKTACLHL